MDAFLSPCPHKVLCDPCCCLQGSPEMGPFSPEVSSFSLWKEPKGRQGALPPGGHSQELLLPPRGNGGTVSQTGPNAIILWQGLALLSIRLWWYRSQCLDVPFNFLTCGHTPQVLTYRALSFWKPQALSWFPAFSAFSSQGWEWEHKSHCLRTVTESKLGDLQS